MQISNPDKVLFPDDGITKADLADHYWCMADAMPLGRARPGALVATPLSWSELDEPALLPGQFTIATVPGRDCDQ